MKILLDADILLEAILNRNMFIDEIDKLFKILTLNNIEIFVSELGLSRINSTMKIFNTSRKMRGVFFKLKKPLKKLKITETIAQKAKLLAVDDFESAVEISLAIEANIGAIITHKSDDFSGGEFNILTLTDFQQRHKMEASASGDTNELLARWTIPLEKLLNLNKILHLSPSYTDIKSLEPKESTSQLDLTCSSDEVSTVSTDKLSSQSTPARSLKQVIADSLSNRSEFGRSATSTDVLKYTSLATAHSIHEKHLDDLRTSMSRAIQRQSDDFAAVCLAHKKHWDNLKEIAIQNSRVCSLFSDRLPLQNELAQWDERAKAMRLGGAIATAHRTDISFIDDLKNVCRAQIHASITERLSPQFLLDRTTAKIDILKSDTLATACRADKTPLVDIRKVEFPAIGATAHSSVIDRLGATAHSSVIDRLGATAHLHKLNNLPVEHLTLKSSLNGLNNAIARIGKVQSSLVDSPSIKPRLAQSIAQLEAAKFSGGAIEQLTCRSSLDPWQERIDRSSQINPLLNMDRSCSDRSGLLSQIKMLESMQSANTLDSYLSRKN